MFEVIIDTTDRCFMDCKYCGTNSSINGSKYLEYNKIIEIIVEIKKLYLDHIIFFGGGCFFCHKDWKKILDANKNINANIRIDVPIHSDVLSYLNEYIPSEYNYSASLSLWGVGDVHDDLSRSDSFSMAHIFIETMSKYQDYNYISFVMTKELLEHQEQVLEFIRGLNVSTSVYFHRLMPTGRCSRESLPQQNEVELFCDEILNLNKNRIKITFHHTIGSFSCKAFKNRIFINHDGNVYGCGWVNNNSTNICNIYENDISITDVLKTCEEYDNGHICECILLSDE